MYKIITHFMYLKKFIFFLCPAEGYKNANVEFLTIKTTSEI